MSKAEIVELISFLQDRRANIRSGAVEAILGLSASDDGRDLLLDTDVAEKLRRLIGSEQLISSNVVKIFINLTAEQRLLDRILKQGIVSLLMDQLRDEDCTYKHLIIMLLTNLSQTYEGCTQILQLGENSKLVGLHFRRLIQYFVAPIVMKNKDGQIVDVYEYCGEVLQNVSQIQEARDILLDSERALLPAIFPQLTSGSIIRRRGAAGMIKNCCFDVSKEHIVKYIFSPSVDIITNLLFPLAGPDNYTIGEKDGMNPRLFSHGARKERESDPKTRRAIIESLYLISTSGFTARDAMRKRRVYPVVRHFHEYLDELETEVCEDESSRANESGENSFDSPNSQSDNDFTIDAINKLMSQLLRDDEVTGHVSEVTGRVVTGEDLMKKSNGISEVLPDGSISFTHGPVTASRLLKPNRSIEEAREQARLISSGRDDENEVNLSTFNVVEAAGLGGVD
jgi:Domain of unknown function (DUF383)/Domain of unknown function (DUF384)